MPLSCNLENLGFLLGVFTEGQVARWDTHVLQPREFVLSPGGNTKRVRQISGMPLSCNLENLSFLLGVFIKSQAERWDTHVLQPREFVLSPGGNTQRVRQIIDMPLSCNLVNSCFLQGVIPKGSGR
jgi:hypothetical protein